MGYTTYQDMVEAIGEYYGKDSDIWYRFATSTGGYTEAEINALKQVPGVSVTLNNRGQVLGFDYEYPFPRTNNPVANVDSNIPNASYGGSGNTSFTGRVNGSYTWDGATQTGRLTSGARNVSTGARVATVAGKLNTAITAVSAGMFLGAKIDSALYNIGKFFDLNPPESLNPETWDSLATTDGGKQLIRHLFDIDSNGNTTLYMPEDMIEYMAKYWLDLGLFSDGAQFPDYASSGTYEITSLMSGDTLLDTAFNLIRGSYDLQLSDGVESALRTFISSHGTGIYEIEMYIGQPFSGSSPLTIYYYNKSVGNTVTLGNVPNGYRMRTYGDIRNGTYKITSTFTEENRTIPLFKGTRTASDTTYISGMNTTYTPAITGTSKDPNASEYLNPQQINPNQPLLPQLKQQLPNTFNNPIKENVPQPDGTNKEIVYYPVPWPKITDDTDKPVTGDKNQDDPTVTPEDPSDETEPIKDVITNPNPQPTTPTPGDPATPPDTGSGSTPTVVPPTGQASSLWTVYNPTQAQLDAFGSWLWSSNFVDQIKKLFNDPMQAIIGVHKVFATPSTGSQVNIKCGYIDSGCPAAEVTSQYTTIDCGTVNVREYYGNVLDYSPYTEISLYLPFIGIVKLDVADVMRGSVSVKYHVDVITGACLADVKVNRDGESAVLYQYAGSAIVSYPISSGSYASMAAGVLSLAAGVAGTIMTGGAAAPALIGGAVGLSHLHTEVQKSGGFSGAPGAMGGKKPYLIISRAQEALPSNFEKYEGKPASKTVTLGNCDGFVKVQAINIDDVPATYGELDQIVALLKQGVII